MFRRLVSGLPKDPVWETDFSKLGYFFNEKDQIRKINSPEESFQFKITDNDRFNEVHKEAFDSKFEETTKREECIRAELNSRMAALGVSALYLPQMTLQKPAGASLPIFTTTQASLKTKRSVVIIVNDITQDLGIWSYRLITTSTFASGSSTGIAGTLKDTNTGLIILNPGQLYYSHKNSIAMTSRSWNALHKKSLFHPPVAMSEEHNTIPYSRDVREHINFVMRKLVDDPAWISPDAKLNFIGIGAGGNTLIEYLSDNWTRLGHRIGAAAWVYPWVDGEILAVNEDFNRFIEQRTRAWIVSDLPKGSCVNIPDDGSVPLQREKAFNGWDQDDEADEVYRPEVLCPTFSSGEDSFADSVFPSVYEDMLAFFDEVAEAGEAYVTPRFEVVKVERRAPEEEPEAGEVMVKKVDEDGNVALPPSFNTQENSRDELIEVEKRDEKVVIAGMPVSKDLLQRAGLD